MTKRKEVTEVAARALFKARHSGIDLYPEIAEEVKAHWREWAKPIVDAVLGDG